MTLDLARIGALPALPAAAPADGEAARAATHAEKVTLTAEAREASRGAAPVPRGTVRWYRAARSRPPAPPPSRAPAPERATHAGVAAYRRAMAGGAAASAAAAA
ncbi:hypothetical protein [Anaeromyxobacter diazotrophicus]|uniref:Uncharacterized protein n=1 Tax=Anaeromyxobacter diazotrophicus TaxID=2590199 RepID=A0A7I9VQ39_9BACT|nr:hypothetical protein [Anaeromyxobacter diazotrophicus]GEJ58523.1 hypothetical protein AMYX_32640 [Anaeromyxobacter diazotrophicus]